MYARNAAKNRNLEDSWKKMSFVFLDENFHGIFLRPVHVHSEGQPSETIKGLIELAKDGKLPYTEGKRRGMTQFVGFLVLKFFGASWKPYIFLLSTAD